MSRTASAHFVPGGVRVALVALAAVTVVVSRLGLVLEYIFKKLEVEARNKEAEARVQGL